MKEAEELMVLLDDKPTSSFGPVLFCALGVSKSLGSILRDCTKGFGTYPR